MKFDFELMARLAIEAPDDFAKTREVLIRDAIDSFQTPSKGALLQAQIDALQSSAPKGADVLASVGKRVVALAAMLSKETNQTVAKIGAA